MIKISATAEFTEDMAQTLAAYFDAYAKDGVVKVEVTNQGLWLVNPFVPARQFLGLAALPQNSPENAQLDDLAITLLGTAEH